MRVYRKARLYNKKHQAKNQWAFTLMEIMVVMIIIGIIASFAIPIYSDAVERSRCDNVRINLITLHSACEIFNANFGSYPTTDDLNIEQLNTWLGLNIVTDDFSYLYKVGPPPFITASRAINNPYSIVVDIGSQVNSENPDPCPNSY